MIGQFDNEDLGIEVTRGASLNVFGLLSRSNELIYQTASQNINADFVIKQVENLAWRISKLTVVVLDNGSAHMAQKLTQWADRALAASGQQIKINLTDYPYNLNQV